MSKFNAAYLDQKDPNLLDDINKRKEYAIFATKSETEEKNIIPRFLLEDIIGKEYGLSLHSYQRFINNFMNPNTSFTRLLLKWTPGMGKTIGSLSLALSFINYYNKQQESGSQNIGSVYIIGFTEYIFRSDLIKFPEFGFINEHELKTLAKLKKLAYQGDTDSIEKINEIKMAINRRLSNRKGNGFFKFIGYKSLLNKLFLSRDKDITLTNLTENEIAKLILDGVVVLNKELMNEMKNSLFICDEIHNVYNSAEKNNWGVALQTILNYDNTIRAVFLSATPLNNNPTELIDLLNLLTSRKDYPEFKKPDFFTKDNKLIDSKIDYLKNILSGRISFITNNDSRYFPAKGFVGETIPGIDYLKFIRCPMSKFHYDTYKQIHDLIDNKTLNSDSQYIIDFVLPDPKKKNSFEAPGIYKTTDIRNVFNDTSSHWKNKYKLQYKIDNDVLSGEILNIKNDLNIISGKYFRLINDVIDIISNKKGKIFIYHNVIHMSGVLFIGEILRANGFIDESESSSDNTLCVICGKMRKDHKKEQLISGGSKNIEKEYIDIDSIKYTNLKYNDQSDELDFILDPYIKCKDSTYCKDFLEKLLLTISTAEKDIMIKKDILDLQKSEFNLQNFNDLLATFNLKLFTMELFPNYFYISKNKPSISKEKCIIKLIDKFDNKFIGGKSDNDHIYMPCRYTLVHSNINRKIINKNIELFNSITNSWGEHLSILVGGKIMKESINLMGVQHILIAGRPDNIPTMLQINGRAIRTNSHVMLPKENRLVNISIYVSSLPSNNQKGELSYEEYKYKQKIEFFKEIQKIEKIFHEMAIDKLMNYDIIFQKESDLQKKQYYKLDILPYSIGKTKKYNLDELNLETFNAYYSNIELKEIKFIIKKLFIEISPVWKYSDLFEAVKNYNSSGIKNYNYSLISEENFIIALDQLLIKDDDKYIEPHIQNLHNALNESSLYHKLKNPLDRYIYIIGNNKYGITHIGEYYIAMPIDHITNDIIKDIELPFRIGRPIISKSLPIKNYLLHDMNTNYNDKKIKFIKKWEHIDIRNLEIAMCDFGTNFHRQFVEEIIEYIFNLWTNLDQKKSPYHVFYIKMIYYYDLRNVIIWAHTVSDKLFSQYKQWTNPISEKLNYKIMDKAIESNINSTSGLLNLIKTSINKNDTNWASTGMINDFNTKVKQSLALFDGNNKKKITKKVNANDLPIGHFIGKIPRFYNPNKGGWYDDITYLEYNKNYKENDIIIGYDDKSKTGINVRFKLRNPIQNITQYKDTRQIEKGSVCSTKSKTYLYQIAKKLEIDEKSIQKNSVEDICMKIRTRLIYNELKERSSNSNIKYFYFLHEIKPELMITDQQIA